MRGSHLSIFSEPVKECRAEREGGGAIMIQIEEGKLRLKSKTTTMRRPTRTHSSRSSSSRGGKIISPAQWEGGVNGQRDLQTHQTPQLLRLHPTSNKQARQEEQEGRRRRRRSRRE